ncbi:MAG TPA: dockerin type I domain-containing protein [Thermoguttaceae bacterium]|nr:dockerin type I domain-containing protein [Thermoguttaceae bacterium]
MRRFVISLLFAFLLLTVTVHGWAIEADPISPGSWSMVILPDTQHYAENYPDIYYAQTAWIAAHKDTHNIKMVVHEGDITDRKTETEWYRAKAAMSTLSTAGVPYSMCIGNHDRDPDTRATLFNSSTFFGPGSAYASQSQFQGTNGGFYEAGKTANSWCTFNAGGEDWLIFSVEYGPNNEMVTWMDNVAAAHPNHNFILNTHAYMYYDDTRYDYATYGSTQQWSPHDWAAPDSVNDGQELWDKLVKKYPNWKFTFNGHVLADGTGWLASTGDNGNVVHQMLLNFQERDLGGEGYLRIMEFNEDGETVKVSSYSPYLGSYLQTYDHKFTFNMNELPTIRGTSSAAIDVADTSNVWTIVGSGLGQPEMISPANLADASLAVNSLPTYRNQGVMMVTVRQNSRNGYYGTAEVSQTTLFDMNENILQVATSRATLGGEYNVNVAAGFFPFADGWIGGHVQSNGSMLERYGVSFSNVAQTATGRYKVTIDSVTPNDGMLFAVGGENGYNHISTSPLTNGTGWDVAIREATATSFSTLKSARWSFVYVDYDAPGLIGGRIDFNGNIIHEEGDFNISHPSTGVYQISITGYTPADGVLLLNIAEYETISGFTAPDDNIISYEAAGNLFLVNVRDRNGSSSPLENGAFVFAFLPYDERLSPATPGDANYDGRVDSADAAVLADHWGDSSVTWAMGDFNLDGTVNARDASILAANWNPAGNESNPVPEPSAFVLLAAMGALGLLRRRRAA